MPDPKEKSKNKLDTLNEDYQKDLDNLNEQYDKRFEREQFESNPSRDTREDMRRIGRIEVADNPAVDIIKTGKRNASIRKGYEFSIFDTAEDLGLQFNPFEGEKA